MSHFNFNKNLFFYGFLLIAAICFFVLDLLLGSVEIPIGDIVSITIGESTEKESWKIIVLDSRVPRALAAILCGASLSTSGLLMQTLFKNPLAGPYILGISSGAGLGVAIFMMGLSFLGISTINLSISANSGIILSSILGSLMVFLILLSIINRINDIMTILIIGVMIGSIISAIIGVIQFFSNAEQLKSFILWSMGNLSSITRSQVIFLAPIIIIGLLLSFLISKSLNSYLLGENYAKSIGLDLKKSRLFVILIASILTGSTTAYCGPIGFIGIVIPHIARMLSGSWNHHVLIPYSILLGINILLIADILSQLPGLEQTLPINSLTALIGIPVIIWIIVKNKRITNLN